MNPLGVHALVWSGDLDPESARHVITQTRKAGFDLVELSLHGPHLIDMAMTRDLLQENGIQVACSRGLTFAADVSSEDSAVVAKGLELLKEGIDVTAQLGGHYFGGILYGAMDKYPGAISAAGRRNSVQSVQRIAEYAAEKDVNLGLEVVNRYESNLLNTAEQALEFLEQVNAPNVKIHMDTYHMNIEEPDFMQPVLACGDKLGYVHIGESHRGYLGTGTINFQQLFDALNMIQYDGVITFESFSSAVVNEQLSNALAIWRNLWGDGMDLAVHARQFMAGGIQAAARARNFR